MEYVYVIYDTKKDMLMVDERHSQTVLDYVKRLSVTKVAEMHHLGVKISHLGNEEDRIHVTRIDTESGKFPDYVTKLIESFATTSSSSLTENSITTEDGGSIVSASPMIGKPTVEDDDLMFREFMRLSHDLPGFLSVTKTEATVDSDDEENTSTPAVVTRLVTSDGMMVEGKDSYMFRYDGCELHFGVDELTLVHPSKTETHTIPTESVCVTDTVMPICMRFANSIHG